MRPLNNLTKSILAIFFLFCLASASPIISLNTQNFDQTLQDSEYLLVNFFRPTCPYCRQFAPDYEKIANELSRTSPNVKVGSIDTSLEPSLQGRFAIMYVPTIMLFKKGNQNPVTFSENREINTILSWVSKQISGISNDQNQKSAITSLDTQNFDQTLQDSEFMLVEFFRPSCPYCRQFAPDYEKIANELSRTSPNVKVSSIDTSIYPSLAGRFQVTGVPRVMLFKKGDQNPVTFSGIREIGNVLNWVSEQVSTTPNDQNQKSAITSLNTQNFDQALQDSEFLLVEFFRPSCPYCRQFAPDYEKIANELSHTSPNVKVSSIDTSIYPSLAGRFEVTGVPRVMLFKKGSQNPVTFSGIREIGNVLSWVSKETTPEIVNKGFLGKN